ncbi:Camp-Specific 3',5'-Cyclic Phosphodiesterase 7B [Manis pentadactyla]|nr:Camp-Specific 3',5'-Cyclic Phosphodiesterase 7B [Manis pentadactyla]
MDVNQDARAPDPGSLARRRRLCRSRPLREVWRFQAAGCICRGETSEKGRAGKWPGFLEDNLKATTVESDTTGVKERRRKLTPYQCWLV